MMANFLVHVGCTIICPHGGQVSIISTNTRVLVSGQPVGTQSDTFMIAGCPFALPPVPTPHPCVMKKWLVPSLRIKVNNQPVILKDSTGICQAADQAPQGPPNVITTQLRVKGE